MPPTSASERLVAVETNATERPSAESAGSEDAPFPGLPFVARLTGTLPPVEKSKRKMPGPRVTPMSKVPAAKATRCPSAEIEGERLLSRSAGVSAKRPPLGSLTTMSCRAPGSPDS